MRTVGRVDTVDRDTNDNYCASQLVQEVVQSGRMQGAVTTNNNKRLRDSAMSGNDFLDLINMISSFEDIIFYV